MILRTYLNKEAELRAESYCDCCERFYTSNIEGAVQDIKIKPGWYSYTVSVCPDCISRYNLDYTFALKNDGLDILVAKKLKIGHTKC